MRNLKTSRTAYIYLITFLPNPVKVYVGKTLMGIRKRWHAHCGEARRKGAKSSMHIARAIASHGTDQFSIRVLEECKACFAGEAEQRWIREYRKANYILYNLTDGGDGPYGWHHSMESRIKISDANKGKVISGTTRSKISNSLKGHPVPQAVRERIRSTKKGTPPSKEAIKGSRRRVRTSEGRESQRQAALSRWASSKHSLMGMVFGSLQVVGQGESKRGERMWTCRCSCGVTVEVSTSRLRNGKKRTCGFQGCPVSKKLYQQARARAWETRKFTQT